MNSGITPLLTTYKVVIDANDAAHARCLREALANDGYRVHVEEHQIVEQDGHVTIERIRLNV